MLNQAFEKSLNPLGQDAWKAFKWMCKNFLGKHKSSAYADDVQSLLDTYQ